MARKGLPLEAMGSLDDDRPSTRRRRLLILALSYLVLEVVRGNDAGQLGRAARRELRTADMDVVLHTLDRFDQFVPRKRFILTTERHKQALRPGCSQELP